MLPLLPFAAGLLAGAAAVKLLRSDKARAGLGKAQESLREATVSGLAAIEHSSATMKQALVAKTPHAASDASTATDATSASARTPEATS